MKKYSYLILVVLAGMLSGLLIACSDRFVDETNQNVNLVSVEESELIRELEMFDSMLVESEKEYGTRSLFDFYKYGSVAIKDAKGAYDGAKLGGKIGGLIGGAHGAIVGAIVGGAVVGGASSYMMYKMAVEIEGFRPYSEGDQQPLASQLTFNAAYSQCQTDIKAADYEIGLACGLDSCATRTGIIHNKILQVSICDSVGSMETEIASMSELEQAIVSSEEFIQNYDIIVADPMAIEADPDNKADKIMKMVLETYEQIGWSKKNVIVLIGGYTEKVKNSSELSDTDKDALLTGFSVLRYSYDYWMGFGR